MNTPRYELVEIPTSYPIVTSDGFVDNDGTARRTHTASVVMKFEDGSESTVMLERRAGGRWWAPAETAS